MSIELIILLGILGFLFLLLGAVLKAGSDTDDETERFWEKYLEEERKKEKKN